MLWCFCYDSCSINWLTDHAACFAEFCLCFETHFRALNREVILVVWTNGANKCFEMTHCDIYRRSYISEGERERERNVWKMKIKTYEITSIQERQSVCVPHINFVATLMSVWWFVIFPHCIKINSPEWCHFILWKVWYNRSDFILLSEWIKSEWNCFILSHLKPTVHYN